MKEKEMTTEIVKKRGRDRETNMEKEHWSFENKLGFEKLSAIWIRNSLDKPFLKIPKTEETPNKNPSLLSKPQETTGSRIIPM
jgi:hypothetical protein